jgi:hypothetical protein
VFSAREAAKQIFCQNAQVREFPFLFSINDRRSVLVRHLMTCSPIVHQGFAVQRARENTASQDAQRKQGHEGKVIEPARNGTRRETWSDDMTLPTTDSSQNRVTLRQKQVVPYSLRSHEITCIRAAGMGIRSLYVAYDYTRMSKKTPSSPYCPLRIESKPIELLGCGPAEAPV